MSAQETFAYVLDTLAMDISVTGLDNVPREGLAVITPNHPAGIADGIAVYDALRQVRSDITFFANPRCHPHFPRARRDHRPGGVAGGGAQPRQGPGNAAGGEPGVSRRAA